LGTYYYHKQEIIGGGVIYDEGKFKRKGYTRSELQEVLTEVCAPGEDVNICNKFKKRHEQFRGIVSIHNYYPWLFGAAIGISICISAFFIRKTNKPDLDEQGLSVLKNGD